MISKKIFLMSIVLCFSLAIFFFGNTNLFRADQINSQDILNLYMCPPKIFNPLINTDKTVDKILRLTFEPLLKINSDLTFENRLIKNITFCENKTADVELRSDVSWSDGSKLTSDDVLFSVQQIKSAGQNSVYNYVSDSIVSCKKKSAYELSFQFKDGSYISYCVLDFPVIQKKYFSSTKNSDQTPVCDGAYKFDSYTRMKNLILTKNENYSLDPISDFKKINVIILPESETSIFAFNQGVINLIETDLKNMGKFRKYKSETDIPTNELEFIYLNPKNNLFAINPVREAIINIFDIDTIRNKIYSGILDRSMIDSIPPDKDDDEHIKKIISECDLKSDLRILVNTGNSSRANTANFIKKKLSDYGLKSVIHTKGFDEYQTDFNNRNYDIFIGGFKTSTCFDFEKLFSSENIFGHEDTIANTKWQIIKHAASQAEFESAINDLNNSTKSSFLIILGSRSKKILSNMNIEPKMLLN